MLQELVLSIVETYLTQRRSAALWRGSRLEDSRIRHAIGLLRARPNKDQSMDDLASQVGLSRSRFYDLFQICTGFSPRTYLDMLCVETAISRLSSGQGRISDVSAELGFSAQSNFTRFFQQQVGVPPSEYRRCAAGLNALPAPAPEK
jgi:AraC-like DNA-binding protein